MIQYLYLMRTSFAVPSSTLSNATMNMVDVRVRYLLPQTT